MLRTPPRTDWRLRLGWYETNQRTPDGDHVCHVMDHRIMGNDPTIRIIRIMEMIPTILENEGLYKESVFFSYRASCSTQYSIFNHTSNV